tara:strand:+ start:342 stop:755 length:414 start_codon:yes stop_codon:yes gene_type:complete
MFRSPALTCLEIKLSFILCSVFTLLPYDSIFITFALKNRLSHNLSGQDFIFYTKSTISDLHDLINKLNLRQYTYFLLEAIFRNTTEGNFELLTQYLKKFRYNYRVYFLPQIKNYSNLSTDYEINTFAIQTLYVLAGL